MSDLTVNIQTPSGFEVQGALIPDNITVQQVIGELLGGLSLPRSANGQPINYSLVLVNKGLVLRGDQTLQDGGVQFGDTIRLVTGAEPSNGNQPSRTADQTRNGGASSSAEPAWQTAPPPVSVPTTKPLPPPVAAPPVAAPAVNNDWPRDAAPVSTNDWPRDGAPVAARDLPRDTRPSPLPESPQQSSQSFAMADLANTGEGEAIDSSLAKTHIEIDGGWTASELSQWLGKLELAYSRLNAFLCLSDEDIMRAGTASDGKSGPGSMNDAFALLVAAGNRRGNSLKVARIDFAAEGKIDLTGDQPPIKIMSEIINGWRQENLAGGNGSRADQTKPSALKALVQRAEQLSGQGRGVFVEGFIHHAMDVAREALEDMAKDIRIKKLYWSNDASRP